LLRGDHDEAGRLERWARALEDRADLRDAEAWQPRAPVSVLDETERAELGRVFGRLLAGREREPLAAIARRAEAEKVGYGPGYYVAALEREAEAVRNAPAGDRNNTLARSAWAVGRFVCQGALDGGDVLAALVPASSLPPREAHAVVRGVLRRRCSGVPT
jgi:hypothetical protein